MGPPPAPGRIFYLNVWFRGGHNNARYSELLPRLERLDRYLVEVPAFPPARAAVWRLLRMSRGPRDAFLFRLGGRRYRSMLSTQPEQAAHFPGQLVIDVDDPAFTPAEAELLSRPNVAALVFTAQDAIDRYRDLGVSKPAYVIPQGSDVSGLSDELVEEVRRRHRRNGEVVVGYMAAWLLTNGDRGGDNPLYNVDHLLSLWERIRARVPHARLWLVGGASQRVRGAVAARDDVVVFGRLPRNEMLAYVKNFDIALYPRSDDQGVRAAKVADYLGAGVPSVSYDFAVTRDLGDAGAGVLVRTPAEFVEAVAQLAGDEETRRRLAAAAAAEGARRDWDGLAAEYAAILDRHLP